VLLRSAEPQEYILRTYKLVCNFRDGLPEEVTFRLMSEEEWSESGRVRKVDF
jgi:hypothetical protein